MPKMKASEAIQLEILNELNPEDIDWIRDAYYLDCVETEELVTVRRFTKVNHA